MKTFKKVTYVYGGISENENVMVPKIEIMNAGEICIHFPRQDNMWLPEEEPPDSDERMYIEYDKKLATDLCKKIRFIFGKSNKTSLKKIRDEICGKTKCGYKVIVLPNGGNFSTSGVSLGFVDYSKSYLSYDFVDSWGDNRVFCVTLSKNQALDLCNKIDFALSCKKSKLAKVK